MSPALAGVFLSTSPPGKSSAIICFLFHFSCGSIQYIVSFYGVHSSHCFPYSFHSLFVPLIGYFQLIFLLTYWFFFFFFFFSLVKFVVESLYWILQFTHCIVFMLNHLRHVWLFVTPWTVAHQGPLSMGFTRQEYCSGLLCTPPGDLPDPGIEPESLTSPALAYGFFTPSITWKTHSFIIQLQNIWLVLFFFKYMSLLFLFYLYYFPVINKYLNSLVTLWASFEVLFWILCQAILRSPLIWAGYKRFTVFLWWDFVSQILLDVLFSCRCLHI